MMERHAHPCAIVKWTALEVSRSFPGLPFTQGNEMDLSVSSAAVQTTRDLARYCSFLRSLESIDPHTMQEAAGKLLVQEGTIRPDVLENDYVSVLYYSPDDNFAATGGGDGHLRLRLWGADLCSDKLITRYRRMAEEMDAHISFARNDEFGYLNASIEDCGHGMHYSCCLHLYALREISELERLKNQVEEGGRYSLHALSGDDAPDDMYILRTNIVLGETAEETRLRFEKTVQECIKQEAEARELYMQEKRLFLDDEICRALAVMRVCRAMEWENLISLCSTLRFACAEGLLPYPCASIDRFVRQMSDEALTLFLERKLNEIQLLSERAAMCRGFSDVLPPYRV